MPDHLNLCERRYMTIITYQKLAAGKKMLDFGQKHPAVCDGLAQS